MDKKIKIIYNNWDAVPIGAYKRIVEINNDEGMETMAKNVASLAILCDTDEDSIWNLSMDEISRLTKNMDWINDFDFKKRWTIKHVTLNGRKYNVTYDLNKMSVAQYIDFQQAWRIQDATEKLVPVLSCFLVPDGHKYGDGYYIEEVRNDIENYLPITQANSICFFFLKKLLSSMKSSLICSRMVLKATKWTTKSQKMKEMMKETERKISQMESFYFSGSH